MKYRALRCSALRLRGIELRRKARHQSKEAKCLLKEKLPKEEAQGQRRQVQDSIFRLSRLNKLAKILAAMNFLRRYCLTWNMP